MRSSFKLTFITLTILGVAACSAAEDEGDNDSDLSSVHAADASTEGGTTDGGPRSDGGPSSDAGPRLDAGPSSSADAGPSSSDAGPSSADAGPDFDD